MPSKMFQPSSAIADETIPAEIQPETNPQPVKKRKAFRWLVLVIIVLLVAACGTSFYFYQKYRALKLNPNIEAQKETESLVAKVGKLMVLPEGETPTVATVQDKSKVQDQPFFKNAENGDKLLAYTKAMEAILYRPSANKIIAVAPIVINQPQEQAAPRTTAEPAAVRVAYYNGTSKSGSAGKAESTVNTQVPGLATTGLFNAKNRDYLSTLVVDLTGTHQSLAATIASALGGQVGILPDGEARPDADILVIVGGQ